MRAECLASSSAGNCFILEFIINGEATRIMVECGLSMKDIYSKMSARGIMLSSIKACLITHFHQDHCKSADKISGLGIPVYSSRNLQILKPNKITDGLYVLPFEVEHDCDGSVGFVIKTKEECVVFVNDHKKWNNDLSGFAPDYVFIECNYNHKMVYAQIGELKRMRKNGDESQYSMQEIRTKLVQHERNVDSHCSLHGTIKGLEKLNLKKCKAIFLMHLSDRYANEYLMKNSVQDRFGIRTYVCKKDGCIK